MHRRLVGLYVITRPMPGGPRALASAVAEAIGGGARVVQFRDKSGEATRRREAAEAVLAVCRAQGIPLLINDDPGLALDLGADGVHLGAGDPPVEDARRQLGDRAIIGVSCYNQLDRALWAEKAGADYVAFGSFFPSPTKPDAVRATPELLREASRKLALPICAIGGITPDNGGELVEAGADLLAVLSGVLHASNVEAAARAYSALFDSNRKAEGA